MRKRHVMGALVAVVATAVGLWWHVWMNTNRFGEVVRTRSYVGVILSPEWTKVPGRCFGRRYWRWRDDCLSSLIGGGDLAWVSVYDVSSDRIIDFCINTPR